MISEDNAKELVESIKDKGIACVKYYGIETVPNSHIKMTYKVFPEELKNKKVHVFEGLSSADEKISVTLCQYYVDSIGSIYKDTYPSNAQCIKIK